MYKGHLEEKLYDLYTKYLFLYRKSRFGQFPPLFMVKMIEVRSTARIKYLSTLSVHFAYSHFIRFHSRGPILRYLLFGLGGLGVTCSSRDPRFAGSNPAEVDGFVQNVKILCTSPSGGTSSWGPESEISGSLKNLKPEKIGL